MKTRLATTAAAILIALSVVPPAIAQTPAFQWAKRVASTSNCDFEPGHGLAIDSAANLFVTGWFDGTNDFGSGVMLTNTPGGGQDIFVAKYNSAGTIQWAQQAGGDTSEWDSARGLGVDNSGQVYVAGGFYGLAHFGSSNALASQGGEFFLAKYGNAGSVQWVQQSEAGASGYDLYATGLAVDGTGNSYSLVFLDHSSGQGLPVTFGSTNVMIPIGYGLCTILVKYDSTGTTRWAQLLGSSNQCYSTAVSLDGSGNVYVGGAYRASLRVGTTNFTNSGDKDGFVAKFNSAGNFQWARRMVGRSDSGVESIVADSSGNIYVAGGFGNVAGDTNFYGSSISLTNIGGGFGNAGIGDAYLAKYNGTTGTPLWAIRAGGTNADAYTGVAIDTQTNVYVTGGTGGVAAPGGFAGFKAVVTKYNTNGVAQWTQTSTGTNALIFGGPLLDASGNCYVAGMFQTRATFATNTLTGLGCLDFFLAKLGFAPPTLGIAWSNSLPRLSVAGAVSNRFTLEYTPALAASNNWQSLVTTTLTSTPFLMTDTNAAGNAKRFYRARLVP